MSNALSIPNPATPEIVLKSCEYTTSSVSFCFPSIWNLTLFKLSPSSLTLFKFNAINGLFLIVKSAVKLSAVVVFTVGMLACVFVLFAVSKFTLSRHQFI